jgi:hypothetical protein
VARAAVSAANAFSARNTFGAGCRAFNALSASSQPPGQQQGTLSSLRHRLPSATSPRDPFARLGLSPPAAAANAAAAVSPAAAAAKAAASATATAAALFAGLPAVSAQQAAALAVPLHLARRLTPEQVRVGITTFRAGVIALPASFFRASDLRAFLSLACDLRL